MCTHIAKALSKVNLLSEVANVQPTGEAYRAERDLRRFLCEFADVRNADAMRHVRILARHKVQRILVLTECEADASKIADWILA